MPYKDSEQARIRNRQYYHLHKEECKKYRREYRQNNKEKIRKYYLDNAEKFREKSCVYRQQNRVKESVRTKIYRKNNSEKIKEMRKNFYEKNKIKLLANHKKIRQQKRIKLMNILGGIKCDQCGFDNQLALEIHHINNDGNKDRIIFRNSLSFIIYYVKHPIKARSKLQILCANCHKLCKKDL